jgi:hypothetical protein
MEPRELLASGRPLRSPMLRDAAFHDLQPVLRHQGQRVDRGIDVLDHDPDPQILEVALLDRDHGGGRGQRPHHPDPHRLLLRPGGAAAERERQEQGGDDFAQANHDQTSGVIAREGACEEISAVRSRGRGDPAFAQFKCQWFGKDWIPASAGMSGSSDFFTRSKAGDPVFRKAPFRNGTCFITDTWRTGCPAFAGHDTAGGIVPAKLEH